MTFMQVGKGPTASRSAKTMFQTSRLLVLRRRHAAYSGCNEFPQAPISDDSTLIAVFWHLTAASGRLLRTPVQSPNTESNSPPKAGPPHSDGMQPEFL